METAGAWWVNQNGGDVSVPKWSTPIRGVVRHQEPNNPIFPGKFPNSLGHSSSKRIYHFFFAFHNSSPQHFSTKQPPTLGFSKKEIEKIQPRHTPLLLAQKTKGPMPSRLGPWVLQPSARLGCQSWHLLGRGDLNLGTPASWYPVTSGTTLPNMKD